MPNPIVHVLSQEIVVKAPLGEVFEFFSSAENLQRLTPSSLEFKILSPTPVEMKPGAMIDYRLKLMGVPFKWRTEIKAWNPPFEFSDNQDKGPYLLWLHTHRFEEVVGGTKMTDQVQYKIPGWIVEPMIHSLFVKPQIQQIFKFRNQVVGELFGTLTSTPPTFTNAPAAL